MSCKLLPNNFIIVFSSTRALLLSRTSMDNANIPYQLINTPRDLHEQCGMCIRVNNCYRKQTEQVLPPTNAYLLYIDYDETH